MKHDFSKGTSLALVAGMYVLALCIGVRAFAWAVDVMPEVWALLVADVAMTVLIWGFGLAAFGVFSLLEKNRAAR